MRSSAGFRTWKRDLPAGIAAFLVAVPLCLGIAHASGAPLLAGLISGILGGLVVGWVSGSPLSVSGPAAGLTTIVVNGVTTLGSFEAFLTATMLAGLLQALLGKLKAGSVSRFFPSPVVKGMLAAVGLTLMLKQLPAMLGYAGEEGSDSFEPAALFIGLASLALLVLWDRFAHRRLPFIPASLLAIAAGVVGNALLPPALKLGGEYLVQVPQLSWAALTGPDLRALLNPHVYLVAFTVALVASVESLLSVEAMDRLDPLSRRTPANRELVAQGLGNFLAGICGGLPITAVIVRGSVNLSAGAASKASTIIHGVLILISMVSLRHWLNLVPLSSLAAILVQVGARLASPATLTAMIRRGTSQSVPYFVTAIVVLGTNLLIGIGAGLLVAGVFILRSLYLGQGFRTERHGRLLRLEFAREVTFFHKARLADVLESVPPFSRVEVDASRAHFVDRDVLDILDQFRKRAFAHNIEFAVGGLARLGCSEESASVKTDYLGALERNQGDPAPAARHESPLFLVIGCIDCQVPAEKILRIEPDRLLVHLNVAGVVSPHDVNLMSLLEFGVEALGIPHIVVCGHYGCRGIQAALSHSSPGVLLKDWLRPVEQLALDHADEMKAMNPVAGDRRLTELHVLQQALNLVKSPVVQISRQKLGTPSVHAWVLDEDTGLVQELKHPELAGP